MMILLLPQAGMASELSLAQAISQVLSNSPALSAARLKWQASQHRPDIVGALPDPMVTYGYWFQNVETRVGAMNQKVAVSQRIPFPGKRSLAMEQARHESNIALWDYQALGRDLIWRTKTAYIDLVRIRQSRLVLDQEAGVLESMVRTALTRYEAALGPQQEVLKAQLALSNLTNRWLNLEAQRETAVSVLNGLRNLPPSTPIAVDDDLQLPPLPDQELSLEVAGQYRQELQAAGIAIQRDTTAVALARRDRWPDFTVGVDYTQINDNIYANHPDNGQDAVLGFVSIHIPLWPGKLRAQRREAEARLAASLATSQDLQSRVRSQAREAWFRASVAQDQAKLYRDLLIPQAEQSFQTSLHGYQASGASFLDVLDAERALLDIRLGRVMIESELAQALAQLERQLGVDLENITGTSPKAPGLMEELP